MASQLSPKEQWDALDSELNFTSILGPWFRSYRQQIEMVGSGKQDKRSLQYFKDERFLTLFGLESLFYPCRNIAGQEASGFHRLFQQAFAGKWFTGRWKKRSKNISIGYEKDLPECIGFRKYLSDLYSTPDHQNRHLQHPVKYERDKALQRKDMGRYEGPTQADAVISFGEEKVFVESKFVSDASTTVSYLTLRNQLARNIEAGLQNVKFKVENFWFLLLSPRVHKIDFPDSRLYTHLMRRYRFEPQSLRQDLVHLEEQGLVQQKDWEEVSLRLGHATWEDIRQITFDLFLMPVKLSKAMEQFWEERQVLLRPLHTISVRSAFANGAESMEPILFETLPEFKRLLENKGAKRVSIGRRSALTDSISYDTPSMFPYELNEEHIATLTKKPPKGELDDHVFLNTN